MTSRPIRAFVVTVCVLSACFGITPHPSALGQSAAGGAASPTDSGWPRMHEKDGQSVVIVQPQIDSWKDHTRIEFRAATAVTPRGATEPSRAELRQTNQPDPLFCP